MNKRLFKDSQTGLISGVCSGIAQYFNVDVSIVRIATVLVAGTGAGLLAYIAAIFILPEKDTI